MPQLSSISIRDLNPEEARNEIAELLDEARTVANEAIDEEDWQRVTALALAHRALFS
jgi:hypothetical protein